MCILPAAFKFYYTIACSAKTTVGHTQGKFEKVRWRRTLDDSGKFLFRYTIFAILSYCISLIISRTFLHETSHAGATYIQDFSKIDSQTCIRIRSIYEESHAGVSRSSRG